MDDHEAGFGAIDEAMALYQGRNISDEEAVETLLIDLRAWCVERGVPFELVLAAVKAA